jgi:dTDP-4-amino-4,6-dideoxygalactose transaminase
VPVPLFDLGRLGPEVDEAVREAALRVLGHRGYVLGAEVEAFERDLEAYLGEGHAVGMSSGTDAQLALLMALGIGPGDAVVSTPYTFFATAGCIHRAGAEILFCDIDPATFMMDAGALRMLLSGLRRDGEGMLRSSRGNRVRLIVPIHLFGALCDMDAIGEVAAEFGIEILEDAAQILGGKYPSKDGIKGAGLIAPTSYVSFYPSKNLGAAGDAGVALCLDAGMAEKLRRLRNHGMEERYYHKVVGGNFRIDAVQAAVLRAKLPFLDSWNAARRSNADSYRGLFEAAGLLDRIVLPPEPHRSHAGEVRDHHIFHQYVIRIPCGKRDALQKHLADRKIGTAIYYPVPLHLQECFSYLGHQRGDFPASEQAALEALALPIFPGLTRSEQEEVVDGIKHGLNQG